MSGREQAYREFVAEHPIPPNINDYPERSYDYPRMIAYAKSMGKTAAELSEKERREFLRKP